MIEFISFSKKANCFAAHSAIEFKNGINLIVGDQGCGKSTLLSQIDAYQKVQKAKQEKRQYFDSKKCKIELIWKGSVKRFGYFDFEKHNPRTQPAFGMGYGYDTGYQVSAMFSSHGQSVMPLLFGVTNDAKDCIAVLDEPDMALSPRSIHKLIKELKKIEEEGSAQIILSAHNPLLIAAFPMVCSLEHNRWMPSSEFLELQATTEAPKYDNKTPRKIVVMLPRKDTPKPKDAADDVVDSLLGDECV